MQLCGAISYLSHGFQGPLLSVISQDIDDSVVDDTMSTIKAQADWFPNWMLAGWRYRELAETALAEAKAAAGKYRVSVPLWMPPAAPST